MDEMLSREEFEAHVTMELAQLSTQKASDIDALLFTTATKDGKMSVTMLGSPNDGANMVRCIIQSLKKATETK